MAYETPLALLWQWLFSTFLVAVSPRTTRIQRFNFLYLNHSSLITHSLIHSLIRHCPTPSTRLSVCSVSLVSCGAGGCNLRTPTLTPLLAYSLTHVITSTRLPPPRRAIHRPAAPTLPPQPLPHCPPPALHSPHQRAGVRGLPGAGRRRQRERGVHLAPLQC